MKKKITETEKEVLNVLKERWKIGRKRYGEGISFKQNDIDGWINNAIEEAADMLQYLVALKIKLIKNKERKNNVRK